jgi:diguanylate cyclase (GGDEF)-like protein
VNGSPSSRNLKTGVLKARGYYVYLYSMIGLGFASIICAVIQLTQMDIGYKWMILAALTVLTSSWTIRIPATNSKISIGDTFFFTNIILFGIPSGIITAVTDALASSLRARNHSRRLEYSLFNVAAIACSAFSSGAVFFLILGQGPLTRSATPPVVNMLLPLAAMAFAQYICNSGSIAMIVALEKRRNIVEIWKDSFLWTSITYFAGAAAAGFIALTVGTITPQVIAVAVPVLLAIYFTYKTYLDKVQQVCSLAYYDSLTQLPNRMLFKERLNQVLALPADIGKQTAIMFLDLDNFKRINDTYGHSVGDALLRCVAGRLTSILRIQDRDLQGELKRQEVVIGRFGGDEFTLMLSGIDHPQQAAIVAQRILLAFSTPFALDGKEVSAAVSIGISIAPMDGHSADVLLKNADAAMFHAKDCGRNSFQFYSQSMNEISLLKMSMENDLRKAIERNEFRLFYQPKVDGQTREITGAEALIRWQHPVRGLLPAGEFIPVAEETGLIRPMGEWVLRAVCQQFGLWKQAGLPVVPVAVNLSGTQFRQQRLQEIVSQVIQETSMDPTMLELEITESMIMQNQEDAEITLRELRKLGCKISIDDFGTGYSSLNRLKRFTLDALKVDRSFITDLNHNPDDMAITKAIIAMARSLELKVVAEGVETEEQFQFLKEQGCDEIQGFLCGRPMPPEEFALLLANKTICQSGAGSDITATSGSRLNRPNLRLVSVRHDNPRQPSLEEKSVNKSTLTRV